MTSSTLRSDKPDIIIHLDDEAPASTTYKSHKLVNGSISIPRNITHAEKAVNSTKVETSKHRLFKEIEMLPNQPNTEFTMKELITRVNCHGFSDWSASESKTSYIFWAIILLASFAVATYYIIQCFISFYRNPIQTTINVAAAQSIPFPDVFICPANFIDNERYQNLTDDQKERVDYFKTARLQNRGLLGTFREIAYTSFVAGQMRSSPEEIALPPEKPTLQQHQEDIFKASFAIKDLIPECQFAGKNCYQQGISIHKMLDPNKGVCYLIVMQGNEQWSPSNGLRLIVDLHTEKEQRDDINKISTVDGITVRFEKSHNPIGYGGTLLMPGRYAQLSLASRYERYITVSAFSKTPQKCHNDGEVWMKVLTVGNAVEISYPNNNSVENSQNISLTASYTKEACNFDCALDMVLTKIAPENRCLLPVDVRYISKHILHNRNIEFCKSTKTAEEEYTANWTLQNMIRKCREKCHIECEKYEYPVTASYHKFPSAVISGYYHNRASEALKANSDVTEGDEPVITLQTNVELQNEAAYNDFKRRENNIILLDIGFNQMHVTNVIQSPAMTVNTLLSNLGGIAGLWLGASLFTLLQVVVFVGKFILTKCFLIEH